MATLKKAILEMTFKYTKLYCGPNLFQKYAAKKEKLHAIKDESFLEAFNALSLGAKCGTRCNDVYQLS